MVIGVALTHWPSLARLIRAEVIQLRESPYIQISCKLGKSSWYIARKHMLPHLVPQFIVGLVLMFPHAILSSITFLGFGLSTEQPAIGIVLSEAMQYLITGKWWLALFPGLLLVFTVVLFYILGESLRKKTVLKIEHMNIVFTQYDRGMHQTELPVIRNLDVEVRRGEVVAVAGSSGSGKSLLAHGVMGVLPYNARMGGDIQYLGEKLTKERIEKLRGKEIVMVPQSISSLNPLMKIGPQIRKGKKDPASQEKLKAIFRRYHLEEKTEELYPFELSGGMNRRVLISTAVMEEPRLVIADEPTPGLDKKTAKRAMEHFRNLADMGGQGRRLPERREPSAPLYESLMEGYAQAWISIY